MAMFLGRFHHTMDAKGRVSLPARYRDDLAKSPLVIVEGDENCLWLYRYEDFEKMTAGLQESDLDETLNSLRYEFISTAEYVDIDGNGRIRVSADLRDYAGLSKSVTLTGTGTRLELWDSEAFEARRKGNNKKVLLKELSERRKSQSSS